MANYQKLEAWKESMFLVKDVYVITGSFPKEELYGLTSQMKRAAVSIPANIAEGMGRQYKKDTLQFLHIARGSIYELETLLNIAVMINIMDAGTQAGVSAKVGRIMKLLGGLINYLETSPLK